MDLGCLDLGCVSVSDKHGTEVFAAKSDSRDDNVREAAKASFRIGKVKVFVFRFSRSRIKNILHLSFLIFFAVLRRIR